MTTAAVSNLVDSVAFAPIGHPRDRTSHDLLVLALLMDDDVEPAADYWRRNAPLAYRGLLDGDGWTFDERRQRYVSDTGTRLRPAEQKHLAVLLAVAMELDLEAEAKAMAKGDIEIGEWQDRTAAILKNGYAATAALGVGGIGRLTDADRLIVTGKPESPASPEKVGETFTDAPPGTGLRDAYERLDRFGRQVARQDETAHTADQVVTRAGGYAHGAHAVYEEARRASHGRARDDAGNPVFVLERNILDDKSDHCAPDTLTEGCPQLTDLGWVPIGSLPPPGTRTCRGNCRCSLEYSGIDGEGEPLVD